MIAGLLPAIAERLRRAGERARAILTEHRSALQAIAHLLERKGYLPRDEISRALASNEDEMEREFVGQIAKIKEAR
jgi:cell division protease FtsH